MLKVFQRPGSGGDASPVVLPELLEALLAGADVGLALFDPELRLLYGNPAFVRFSGTAEPGWSPAAAAGLEGLVAALRGATATPATGPLELAWASRRWTVSVRPLPVGEGQHVLAVTLHDVTEARAAEAHLLEQAARREQLIGILAHELRTPLQALTVSASLLDRIGPLTGAQLRAVARVTSRVQHLQRILWDLLDFTRERLGGGLPVERRTIDVFALVLGLVDDYRAAWPERELHCFCEGDGHGSFDPDRVLQLLTNLLNNALTWGDPDAPIELLAQQEGTSIRIRVTNRGATIPPELMDRLFVPFAASRPAPGGSRHRGLGLGLFIARQIASAHGGTLTARSENGATEFTAVLPTRG